MEKGVISTPNFYINLLNLFKVKLFLAFFFGPLTFNFKQLLIVVCFVLQQGWQRQLRPVKVDVEQAGEC